MGFEFFTNCLVNHPSIVLSIVVILTGVCFIVPFTIRISPPNFEEPQLGFTTRGTTISNRLTTWVNLQKSWKPSGVLTPNPRELLVHRNSTLIKSPVIKRRKKTQNKRPKDKPVYGSVVLSEYKNSSGSFFVDLDRWKAVHNLSVGIKKPDLVYDDKLMKFAFCGPPDQRYAHLVIKSNKKHEEDLFTLANLLAMCRFEQQFQTLETFQEFCIQNNKKDDKCCTPWSLPNYITVMNGKQSCLALTEKDVDTTKKLLMRCSNYFHNAELSPNCFRSNKFCDAPVECIKYDFMYNIMNYLTTTSFLRENDTESTVLTEVMLFLPLACSSAILPYYHEVEKLLNNVNEGLNVVAMEFGLKSALFDLYLLRDTWLMGTGCIFIFTSIWFYTKSLFLTAITLMIIVSSLIIAFFLYTVVYRIQIFPFMNLLAVVVCLGIGSDDVFIFTKIWETRKKEMGQEVNLGELMKHTFHHAFLSMLVTTLTTFVAFLGSCVSSVTAISCFSIFAGTAVVANYLLMMTWFPACMILWERCSLFKNSICQRYLTACFQRWRCFIPQRNCPTGWFRCSSDNFWSSKQNYLIDIVIKLKHFWITTLLTLSVVSTVIVFVYPKLQLPDTPEFQLFSGAHLFEQYDFNYKSHFWFKKHNLHHNSYKLPMRFVWGVLPVDNGNHFDPSDFGTLIFDDDFDMADPEAQIWLRNFCGLLRKQAFFESTEGPLLPNCFIETFAKSMQRKCQDSFTGEDLTPCCDVSQFPFTKDVFNKCIIKEMAEILNTPSQFLRSNVAGPKFSKDKFPKIKAVVVEYYSNYSYTMSYDALNEFYTTVETWMQLQLENAPVTMRNGFFVSDLDFYDLQKELGYGTVTAIIASMALALVVVYLSTLNIVTSVLTILTITSSIIVVMAALVLLGWRLNILESVSISTAIGLTVDFSLHYAVNYQLCPVDLHTNRESATRHALSYMTGPAFMAAMTTGVAGAVMLPSLILPYIQIGIFLILVMFVSWIYATFQLGSFLAACGPEKNQCQLNFDHVASCFFKKTEEVAEIHEVEALNHQQRSEERKTRRSLSNASVRYTPTLVDQSSPASAISIILPDEN